MVNRGNEIETLLLNSLRLLSQVRSKLATFGAGQYRDSVDDVQAQIESLLRPGFIRDTSADWLAQYPRYMKAMLNRVERLSGQVPKDVKHTALLQSLAEPLHTAMQRRDGLLALCGPARQYRWMLEELRVSLFAQQLGTRQAVSQKRLEQQWQEVQSWLDANPH